MAGAKNILVGAKTNNRLKGLNPLLHSWAQATLDFCASNNDASWWYNERASLSILAGAAWRLNGWNALEEYSTIKKGVVPDDAVESGGIVPGRCDLALSHRTKNFAVEAKQAWQCIGKRSRANLVAKAMGKASRDAGNLHVDEGDHRLAAVFVAPYLSVSEVAYKDGKRKGKIDDALVRKAIEAWLDELDLAQFDAYAYVFPKKGFVAPKGNRLFPGTLICIKERQRANRSRKTS